MNYIGESKSWKQGMHAIAAQERARMLSRGMANCGVGIGSPPREDGRTVDDQITRSNESAADGFKYAYDEERLRSWSPCDMPALPLLRGTRNARVAIFA